MKPSWVWWPTPWTQLFPVLRLKVTRRIATSPLLNVRLSKVPGCHDSACKECEVSTLVASHLLFMFQSRGSVVPPGHSPHLSCSWSSFSRCRGEMSSWNYLNRVVFTFIVWLCLQERTENNSSCFYYERGTKAWSHKKCFFLIRLWKIVCIKRLSAHLSLFNSRFHFLLELNVWNSMLKTSYYAKRSYSLYYFQPTNFNAEGKHALV